MRKPYTVRHIDEVEGVACPCGSSRRVLTAADTPTASLHLVDIKKDSEVHYHKSHWELYYILRGQGTMTLDGDVVPIRAGHAIGIPPGVRHRARGDLQLINVVVPAFDPEDEYVVEENDQPEGGVHDENRI